MCFHKNFKSTILIKEISLTPMSLYVIDMPFNVVRALQKVPSSLFFYLKMYVILVLFTITYSQSLVHILPNSLFLLLLLRFLLKSAH